MHYYAHHIGDFIKDTANLDDHYLATYLRLIWKYYLDESPITGDIEDIAFAMRSDEKTIRTLLKHFFTESENGWRHSRCDKVIADFYAKSESAKASAKARWDAKRMREESERNANASNNNANEQKSDATHNPKPITHNISKDTSNTTPDGFVVFWKKYPDRRKGSKSKCLEYWKKHNLEKQKEVIFSHMAKMNPDWAKEDGRYAPAPMSYLNKKSWDGAEIDDHGGAASIFEGAI